MLILERDGVFVLETVNTHYVMSVSEQGLLCHEHWGRKCADIEDYRCTYKPWERNSNHSARDLARTEYIPYGGTCYRTPAFVATFSFLPSSFIEEANIGISFTGRLSTQKYPISSIAWITVDFPAPESPVTIISCIKSPSD